MSKLVNHMDNSTLPALSDGKGHASSSSSSTSLTSTQKEDDGPLVFTYRNSFIPGGILLDLGPSKSYSATEQDLDIDFIQNGCEIIPGIVPLEIVHDVRNIKEKLSKGERTSNYNYKAKCLTPEDGDKLFEAMEKLIKHFPSKVGAPEVEVGHDLLDPQFFPESLEFVANLLSERSLRLVNVEKVIQFLLLLAGDLLDL